MDDRQFWLAQFPTETGVARVAGGSRAFSPLRLLARGVDGNPGAAARRGLLPGPTDGPGLAALSTAAQEMFAAIGLEARNAPAGRHLELLQHPSRPRIGS